jgi:hypothetical protein
MSDAIEKAAASQMVPGDFAEKAMASLMQMHSELMDEKERRVELFRKLMEREQIVAELRMYVKLLEEKLNPPKLDKQDEEPPHARRLAQASEPRFHPQAQLPRAPPLSVEIPDVPSGHVRAPEVEPPQPPRVARPKIDGWKTW